MLEGVIVVGPDGPHAGGEGCLGPADGMSPAGAADDVPRGGVFDDLGDLEPVWQDQPRLVRARLPCKTWRRLWLVTG